MDDIQHRVNATPSEPQSRQASCAVEPKLDDRQSARITWISTFSLAPVALAVLTAMFFMTGRAYWLGYLGHFHLEPSLFSDDLSNQATRSVAAWLHAVAAVSDWIRRSFAWTTPALLFLPFALLGLLCVVAGVIRGARAAARWLFGGVARASLQVAQHARTQRAVAVLRVWFAPPAFARSVMRGVAWVYAASYVLYLSFWTIGLILLLLVAPFDSVGRAMAAKDQAAGFSDSPLVSLTLPEGQKVTYRLILCAPRYCALYDGRRAVAVQASSLVRAESPEPNPVNAGRNNTDEGTTK